MTQRKHSKHFGLMLMFIVVVFVALLINSAITALAVFLLVKSGMLYVAGEAVPHSGSLIVFNALISVPIGALVSVAMVKFPLKPVRNLIDGMDALAAGDFKIRMNAGSIMRRYPAFRDVSDSFNKMAEELESTEMLRSDFINNFSHEFKTPIVSIAGFAKLLKRGNLTQEQQQEYLSIIEEESMRLSYMATNVLSLTKVENQTILTDVTEFNLSEQIRSCILMLERKWDSKNLDLQLEFEEHQICANEELLKQVWINLLDNAIEALEREWKRAGAEESQEKQRMQPQLKVCITAQRGYETICVKNQIAASVLSENPELLTSKEEKEKHGLGVGKIKSVAEQYGGMVDFYEEDNFFCVKVFIPK